MLSNTRFNVMLNRMGQSVDWRRAHDCPCRDPSSGAAQYGHALCSGKGVLWDAAIEGVVAIAGQKVQHNWAKMSEYESGDQVLTIPSDSPVYGLGQFDRLTMRQSSTPFSIVLTHSGGEKVPYRIASLDRVFWLDQNEEIVEGGVPTANGDGTLTWDSGEPPSAKQYTLTGRKRPEYFIYMELPQDRAHYGGQALPRRVVARKMDLFGRGG